MTENKSCRRGEGLPGRVLESGGLRLRQILLNFTDNAIKFTERGSIIIGVQTEARSASEVSLHFSVTGTGVGIPADKQQLIFNAFAQADGSTTRAYGGTGLGLSIASQLIHQMQGRVWIQSRLGEGSTFHFTARFVLPSSSLSSSASSSIPSSESRPRTKDEDDDESEKKSTPLRILLAEDNVINRAVATGVLAKRGHSLVHAANGLEALEIATAHRFDRCSVR